MAGMSVIHLPRSLRRRNCARRTNLVRPGEDFSKPCA